MIATTVVMVARCRYLTICLMSLRLKNIRMRIKRPSHPVPEGGDDKTNDDEFLEHYKKTSIQKKGSP